ncbi:MAG: YheT family hydrolase, partial [Microcystaceae cyanobacterium]
FQPPLFLKNGYLMTLYTAFQLRKYWQQLTPDLDPAYQSHTFMGKENVPLYGLMACPDGAKGTIIGTYGITGRLDNQWYLQILGRKAFAQGYGVILFDWRSHGESCPLSPAVMSDGLNEGEDFLHIAAQAKQLGFPAPFWFTGYSLGGQLTLWAMKKTELLKDKNNFMDLRWEDIGGGAAICPNLDSKRSVRHLMTHPLARYFEKALAKGLKQIAQDLKSHHPQEFETANLEAIDSIISYDQEIIIPKLGFPTVEAYYEASCPIPFLPDLEKPTLILYAADDPFFEKTIIPDLKEACQSNDQITLNLTKYGGHIGYFSSQAGQGEDSDRWWAWNRVLDFLEINL